MAIKNRKLFRTNQTTDCSEFCYPSCPYDCYSFPDYYFPPPPPPPPPHSHQLSPLFIVLIALFVSLFILLSYYILIIKSCAGWCSTQPESSQSDGGDEEFLDENRVDHPIWFITTVGLQQSVINSITVCKYKKGEGLIEGSECSVCLSEFQEEEMLRLLPKCSHAFHIHCVDTWLRSHTNCPLCRAHIIASDCNLVAVNEEEGDLSISERTQMEDSEISGELMGENQVLVNGESCENEGEMVEIIVKEGVDSNEQNEILVLGNQEQREEEQFIVSMPAECERGEGRSIQKVVNMER